MPSFCLWPIRKPSSCTVYREKEITEEVLEAHADTIFQEAENRLHAQKAVLFTIATSQGGG